MLNKFEDYLEERIKQASSTAERKMWEQRLQNFHYHLELDELGVTKPEGKSLFITGTPVQEIICFCYEELPILDYKEITVGSKTIGEIPLSEPIIVNNSSRQIEIKDEPILVNGYSLYELTLGV